MQKASQKIKSYANAVDLSNNYMLRVKILRSLFVATLLCVLMYLFFIGNIIFNVLERNAYEGRVRTLSSEVAELELAYLDATQRVDLEYSYSLGFLQVEKNFATRRHLSMQ
jgi:hypothetical protein